MEIGLVGNRRLDHRTPCKRVFVLHDIRLGHRRRGKDLCVPQIPDRFHKDGDCIDPVRINNTDKLTTIQSVIYSEH